MSKNLIEVCAGSGALSLSYRKQRPLTPYLGGKSMYAGIIKKEISHNAFDKYILIDNGLYGLAWKEMAKHHKDIYKYLLRFESKDPLVVWDKIKSHIPENDIEKISIFLLLQLWSFGSKQINFTDRWRHHGPNKTMMYGLPKKPTFGEIKPQFPNLLKKLHTYDFSNIAGFHANSLEVDFSAIVGDNTFYIDPPYSNTTKYGEDDISRIELISLVKKIIPFGNKIIVSEKEDIAELKELGFKAKEVTRKRRGSKTSTFGKKNKTPEYLMIYEREANV